MQPRCPGILCMSERGEYITWNYWACYPPQVLCVCVCVFVCDGGAVREGERQKERLRQSESSNEGTGNWRMLGSFSRK